ncbi:aspartate--tRNA(Asn) ligase [Candidatus Micrarchaeota archaeon]|nr:aspartate--tRNA(Asn) ligase [Candidatus Micrarchaeota archaeon]MBU1165748.1 aspartate--tRNA(Asn) ligase [Candidatus Micrarchaeota archaeon]MBU1887501.1 aspartate--tRNA(Asn) ligase [Candidatus Micrarchaeota archaeon]
MNRTHYIRDAKKHNGEKVRIAGWVHDTRDLGKLKFVLVRDITGIVQVTMKKGLVDDSILERANVNREDVVEFEGEIKENKIAPDGVELIPTAFEHLNKVELKLPVDPTGKVHSELDTRLDNRYIDLRRNEISLIFKVKSIVARAFREKLEELEFIEIHTSAITGTATEGGADVFAIQYFENQAYLVQSPQLYKQLAVIGGFDRVVMTVPVFRAEKHNTTSHLNEITQMDIEMGFADHNDVMDILEQVIIHTLTRVKKEAGEEIAKTFGKEITVPEKVTRYTYTELVERLNKNGFEMKHGWDFTREAEKKLDEVLEEEIYFIYDWPTEVRAFYSMPDEKDENICHAFDLLYRGLEISSGAKRIHLPALLEKQLKKRGLEPSDFAFYINAFRMGAPPHAGWSIGLERFVMKICNQDNIRECMLFPRDRTRLMP